METVGCSVPDCLSSATMAGPMVSLSFLGWQVEDDGVVRCPDHHEDGPEAVAAQVRGSIMLLRIAQKADPNDENYNPKILDKIVALAR